MLIFYLCRNRPVLGAAVYVLFWLPALWGGQMEDPLSVKICRTRHQLDHLRCPVCLSHLSPHPHRHQGAKVVFLCLLSCPFGSHWPSKSDTKCINLQKSSALKSLRAELFSLKHSPVIQARSHQQYANQQHNHREHFISPRSVAALPRL